MKLLSLILTASLLTVTSAFALQIPKDTIVNTIENNEIDSLFADENIPNDSLISNDETLYKNIWSSTQIKYPANTLPPKDVTVTITLTEPYDHPFVNPITGKVISKFGKRGRRMHTGTDIKLNLGDSVLCAFDGKVRLAKRFNGYGNMVLVRHKNGLETLYGHLKEIKVKVNDSIKAGDLIGYGGHTGRATCDHLHFETRLFGEPFDNSKYIDFRNHSLKSNHIYYKNKQFEIDPANFGRKELPESKPVIAANTVSEVKDTTVVKETVAEKPAAPTASTKTSSKSKSTAKATKHVVRKGDNLWVIAKKYNTTVKKLCSVNNITAQKNLKVGSVIRIN
ncbi:MAG: peptidoglycan DD-metalloendopeptidase family protein [Candidatus Saccharibacteria bacterium]